MTQSPKTVISKARIAYYGLGKAKYMDPLTIYIIGVLATWFCGSFLYGLFGSPKEEDDTIGLLLFFSAFWPISVTMFLCIVAPYLTFSLLYDLGRWAGKKLTGEK